MLTEKPESIIEEKEVINTEKFTKKIEGLEAEIIEILRNKRIVEIISPKEIHKCAVEHGWWEEERGIPELLCLCHSEISEALEAYRNHLQPGEKGWVGEELADCVIRIWDMSEKLGIDIVSEVLKKHKVNLERPYRHGNKKC